MPASRSDQWHLPAHERARGAEAEVRLVSLGVSSRTKPGDGPRMRSSTGLRAFWSPTKAIRSQSSRRWSSRRRRLQTALIPRWSHSSSPCSRNCIRRIARATFCACAVWSTRMSPTQCRRAGAAAPGLPRPVVRVAVRDGAPTSAPSRRSGCPRSPRRAPAPSCLKTRLRHTSLVTTALADQYPTVPVSPFDTATPVEW
jgi:hypothetical protein